MTNLWVKIADGAAAFSNTRGRTGAALKALVEACGAKGISIFGYHVPHCDGPEAVDAEIALLVQLATDFALAGIVIDNEEGPAYFRGDANAAEAYGSRLAAAMHAQGKLVVMSSHDIVSEHPKAFASIIGKRVDINAPQVYYGASPSVKARLDRARQENAAIAAPFYPVGVCVVEPHGEHEGAFSDAAKCAAWAKQFIQLCGALHATDPNKYPGYGFWDWDQAPPEFWDVLFSTDVFPRAAVRSAAPARAAMVDAADTFAPVAFDPEAAVAYGQFVLAAYSMYNADPSNLTPRPTPDFPPGYRLTGWVQMKDFVVFETGPTFYGFIAQSEQDPGRFVLALRGTQTPEEWWDDFVSLLKVPFSVPGCGSVAEGFDRIYQTLEIVAVPTGAAAASAVPMSLSAAGGFSRQVATLVARASAVRAQSAGDAASVMTVVGHSLGSALATLYTLENAHEDRVRHPLLCTFASPRVGDDAFVAAFSALPLTSWRIVNKPDVVPMLPPEIGGFAHVPQEIAYDSLSTTKLDIGCWHAMATYLSLLDKSRQPDPAC
ncbi:MAG: lipase family protein, partial [Acetobacteraceae bacterium]|nr:lipase family protein [Acetobacteraceae bacterium]